MATLSLGQAVWVTGFDKFSMSSLAALKSRWRSGNAKKCKMQPAESEPSAIRLQALVPWHGARLADLRLALAEKRVEELKSALEEMRGQRDAWQAMAQARIRPVRTGMSPWQWFGSAKA